MVRDLDPDIHSFNVSAKDGLMSVRCRQCSWRLTYKIGSEQEFQAAKREAVAHREASESAVERMRR